jgi:hypothetical protein
LFAESLDCPVRAFVRYQRKLNCKTTALFQRPKQAKPSGDREPWYDAVAVGENTLGSMMSRISKLVGLCRVYHNHCLRSTVVGILDDEGIKAKHITSVTHHENELSLSSYMGNTSEEKRKEMSHVISKSLNLGGDQPQPLQPLQTAVAVTTPQVKMLTYRIDDFIMIIIMCCNILHW